VRVFYHPADLRRPAEIQDLFDTIYQRFGRLDILVNNAGIQCVCPIKLLSREDWNAVIETNLTAPFLCSQQALRIFETQGAGGCIINIASTHGLVGSVDKVAYVAAKHGVVGLTRGIALEYARTKIICNAICPGFTETPLVRQQIAGRAQQNGMTGEDARRALVEGKHSSGNFIQTEHIARCVIFLCSSAASEMRGSCLTIDGGWTVQ
jgi:3-hydroxybutyrate dehydrogenase